MIIKAVEKPGEYHNLQGIEEAWQEAKEFCRPPPDLTPAEWAERNVRIPLGNAIPGPIRFDNAAYQIEPLNMFADPKVERITLMFGAQTGKTQVVNCALAYFIAHDPSSQMVMQPTETDLSKWLEMKFNPMVEACPDLAGRMAKPRGREGVNNQKLKSYPGGWISFAWSGSGATARGVSAPKIFCDEVDAYEVIMGGHPVNTLWQRAATFGDQRTQMITSTPTKKGSSFVEDSYNMGDQRQFWIDCPHCRSALTLEWKQVLWEKDSAGNHMPETATYVCQHCGCCITDGEKRAAVRNGRWIAREPFNGHVSYHLNELYSGFRKWRDIVTSFLEKKHTNDLESFVNLSLAETWDGGGDRPDEDSLFERREAMEMIPEGIGALFLGVDVQDNRLECSVIGIGKNEDSAVIEHTILYGDPSVPLDQGVWRDLGTQIDKVYLTENGDSLDIYATGIDSGGHFSKAVYDYANANRHRRVFAMRGYGGEGKAVAGKPTTNNIGRCELFPIGVDTVKELLFARLKLEPGESGYVRFSDSLDKEYFEQLASEHVVIRYSKGIRKRVFEKIRQRNEALDCYVYAYAAYAITGVNVSALLTNQPRQQEPEPQRPATPLQSPRRRAAHRPRRNWVTDI